MEEKQISTGNLSRAISKLLEMISGRAARSHTHEGVYAKAGEAITRELGEAGSEGAFASLTHKAMFYIVTIYGVITEGEDPVYTTCVVSGNACDSGSIKVNYYLSGFGYGILTVAKDSAGIMTFSVEPEGDLDAGWHYISRVDGYM